jgi:2-polyprenyl-3-methyl-5-hydroxy-6-metoxy-1,4-benzoquinol methylase
MKEKLLEILVCPFCKTNLSLEASKVADGEINEGRLKCISCQKLFDITNGIPRFVEVNNYASSFGYQWNLFRKEQIDSHNGTDLSARRFWTETGWKKDELKGKWVLDAGCGAGRFLDAASQSEAEIVGIDISNAIDAAKENLQGRKNVHFVQASIYELPFREGTFDKCYCIGVVQHTPDPHKTLQVLSKQVKPGGDLAVTIYERKGFTKLNAKYLIRPLTKKISNQKLLGIIRSSMPVLFPLTNVLFRIPLLRKLFIFTIPVANYVDEKSLSAKQRYDWAILDTFDMLSPQFDQPQNENEVRAVLSESEIEEIKRLPNHGLNIIGIRKHKS